MSNREKMPATASMLDELRSEFGTDTRLIYAAEGDYEVGTEVLTCAVGTTAGGAEVTEETGRRHIGPVATPASRRDDPESSHQAEAEHTQTGRRADQQRQAAEAVRRWPGRTSSELARLSGMDRHALGRRLPEIEAGEGPGQILRAGERRDPETGRSGVRWWPVEVAAEHMARRIVERGREQVAEYRQQYGEWVAQRARERAVEMWKQREVA